MILVGLWWLEETETICRTIFNALIRLGTEILQINEKGKERSFKRYLLSYTN